MPKREPCANAIYLHRRLALSCFPAAEAGPAAIMSKAPQSLLVQACRARGIAEGGEETCIGGRRPPQRVTVLSPLIPGATHLVRDLDWRLWEGGKLPATDADVIVVLRPLEVLRRMSFEAAGAFLINAAFGGGAVYSTSDLLTLLEAEEMRARLRNAA